MKKLYQGLVVAAAMFFAACSSMDVTDAEATAENYPRDFDAAVYAQLHPVLMSLQMRDYVADYNAKYQKSVSKDQFAADTAVDKASFSSDTASLHVFYVSPRYVGYTEADWASLWGGTSDSLYKIRMDNLSKYNLYGVANDLQTLEALPIDYEAIKIQYVAFGKSHGWAYRLCAGNESAGPAVDPVTPVQYPATKLYCMDAAGVTHELP